MRASQTEFAMQTPYFTSPRCLLLQPCIIFHCFFCCVVDADEAEEEVGLHLGTTLAGFPIWQMQALVVVKNSSASAIEHDMDQMEYGLQPVGGKSRVFAKC
jgi:hypothetical protein